MTNEEVKTEARTHYRLNREGIALARRRLHELTEELLRVGVYGEASVNLKITDGIIADVESCKKTVDRIRRRRNGRKSKPSLTGDGRQGDTTRETATPSDDERNEKSSPSTDREDDTSVDET
jgi:hypothetical protein